MDIKSYMVYNLLGPRRAGDDPINDCPFCSSQGAVQFKN